MNPKIFHDCQQRSQPFPYILREVTKLNWSNTAPVLVPVCMRNTISPAVLSLEGAAGYPLQSSRNGSNIALAVLANNYGLVWGPLRHQSQRSVQTSRGQYMNNIKPSTVSTSSSLRMKLTSAHRSNFNQCTTMKVVSTFTMSHALL